MRVKDLGEFELIETLSDVLDSAGEPRVGRAEGLGFRLRLSVGDDAAAWEGPAGSRVLTTDTMVEGVHFNLGRIGWGDLGWKSLAANLSDVAAMGCAPLYSVITLGLYGDLPVSGLTELYRGMLRACHEHGGAVVGGDIVRSPVFFVTVAMVGAAPVHQGKGPPNGARLLTRSSATTGDAIAVTGSIGCSAGGFRMLQEDLSFDRETSAHLAGAHNRPTPRTAEGMLLARHGVTAAIDVSDGLMDDLGKLCAASGVGAIVRSDRIPVDGYLRRSFPDDWLSLALSGGEDYELLFTAPPGVVDEVAKRLDVSVSIIGEIIAEPKAVAVVDQMGRKVQVDHGGWDHFL